jgi:hypothetical protein
MATRSRRTTTTTTTTTTEPAAEPPVPMVLVQWLRTTTDAASEGGGRIGDRRYEGRTGQQVEIREDDAQVLALAGAGFVRYMAEAEPVA